MKRVTITQRKGTETERSKEITVHESPKKGMRYHIPKGSDGYHFDKGENVEKFFKKRYPKADIEIS